MSENEAVTVLGQSGVDQLKSFVQRIENLLEEAKGLRQDINDVYAEAKGAGFDVKILKQIIKLRGMDDSEVQEQDAMLELYRLALGMIKDPAYEVGGA